MVTLAGTLPFHPGQRAIPTAHTTAHTTARTPSPLPLILGASTAPLTHCAPVRCAYVPGFCYMTWGAKFFGDARVAYATLPAYNGGHSFFMSNKVCPTTKRSTPCFLACHRPSPLTMACGLYPPPLRLLVMPRDRSASPTPRTWRSSPPDRRTEATSSERSRCTDSCPPRTGPKPRSAASPAPPASWATMTSSSHSPSRMGSAQ